MIQNVRLMPINGLGIYFQVELQYLLTRRIFIFCKSTSGFNIITFIRFHAYLNEFSAIYLRRVHIYESDI